MRIFLVLLTALTFARAVSAQQIEVDVELVLAADVSRSMSLYELEIQRRGYAEAITSDEVLATIGRGMIGRIAITYMEWAGSDLQKVVVPWTLIESRETAQAVADRLTAEFTGNMRRTSISGALGAAADLFDDNGFLGLRRIIDISGDGPGNAGTPPAALRAAGVLDGLVINGLVIRHPMLDSAQPPSKDPLPYYQRHVIQGPGAFVEVVDSYDDYPSAIRRKLLRELSPPLAALK